MAQKSAFFDLFQIEHDMRGNLSDNADHSDVFCLYRRVGLAMHAPGMGCTMYASQNGPTNLKIWTGTDASQSEDWPILIPHFITASFNLIVIPEHTHPLQSAAGHVIL